MKINVRMFIGDTDIEFKDLDSKVQEEYIKKHTSIYANQVLSRVIEMINEGKTEMEIKKYLHIDS